MGNNRLPKEFIIMRYGIFNFSHTPDALEQHAVKILRIA